MSRKQVNWGLLCGKSREQRPALKVYKHSSDNNFEDMDVLKQIFKGLKIYGNSLEGKVKLSRLFLLSSFIFLGLFISCVPSAQEGGTRSNTNITGGNNSSGGGVGVDNGDFDDPIYTGVNSFIQNGAFNTFGQFQVSTSFNSTLKLKGRQVHEFLKVESNRNIAMCFLARFQGSTNNKLLLMQLIPQVTVNPATNVRERFYLFQSTDATQNLSVCSSPSLVTALGVLYPGENRAYTFDTLCPDCGLQLTSDSLLVYDSDGNLYSGLNTSLLTFQLVADNNDTTAPGCFQDSQCTAISNDFDCCLEGQCVADKSVRPEIDQTSTDFQTIALTVKQQPSQIFNYPDTYFLCPQGSPPDQDPTPGDEVVDRLTKLERLYNCTSPEDNEVGLCTITFEDAGDMIAVSSAFSVNTDDTDFVDVWSGPAANLADFESKGSITKVEYAGKVLYDENHFACMRAGNECFDGNACTNDSTLCPIEKTPAVVPACNFDIGNNNVSSNSNILADAQCIQIKADFANPDNAPHDRLEITYKVDGSCERLNSQTAKCEKYYVQGQLDFEPDDKSPGGDVFGLPSYADTSKQVTVFVDDIQVFQNSDWDLVGTDVDFRDSTTVFDGEVVKIQFFVDISGGDSLLASQDAAQEEINSFCGCTGTLDCGLTAVRETISGVETITDYECDYPELPSPEPPIEQTVFLSAKSVPVRYYDNGGKLVDEIENDTTAQEGNAFEYTNGSVFTPNNASTYVGFNEIYGSLSTSTSDARPPLKVTVKKGRFYNIFVNSGSLASCNNCGNDYYSSLNRVFPDVFTDPGGGFDPDPDRTSRSKNIGHPTSFRSDDLLFGRACWVPATMIPWTHNPSADLFTQRSNRLKAQHFLFANGYQRDWYGFDYGSIIGSFDGMKWFSIGSSRQIKAETTKLYLAVNALFGDIRAASGYGIRVNEVVSNIPDFTIATNDFESDGAQCQSFHSCDKDSDCVTQLGWDYVCENISGIRTAWPSFNDNGGEIANSSTSLTLRSLFGSSSGPAKRCVYRGRGSLCHKNYNSVDEDTSYSATAFPRFHGCSANNHCEDITSSTLAKFNNRIARYKASPKSQNNNTNVPTADREHNTFGLGARIIGRPYTFNGDQTVPSNVANNIAVLPTGVTEKAICIPGRNADIGSGATFEDLNQETNSADGTTFGDIDTNQNQETGDQVNNIGMSKFQDQTSVSTDFLAACPTFNEDGNLLAFETPGVAFDLTDNHKFIYSQNISTNILSSFTVSSAASTSNNPLSDDLLSEFTSGVDDKFMQDNRCLRAPGSVCHTDQDCAPNNFIAQVFKGVDPTSASDYSTNGYELSFWQEDLICGQKSEKYSLNYDLTQNVCCRETGKTLTVATKDTNNTKGFIPVNTYRPPGLDGQDTIVNAENVSISAENKNSRIAPAYLKMVDETADHPALEAPTNNVCGTTGCKATSEIEKQYNTLNEVVGATCCTGHWIREFDETNGGGHKWSKGKFNSIDKRGLDCLNYIMNNETDDLSLCQNDDDGDGCDCVTDPSDPTQCRIRSIPLNEANRYMEFFSSLDLLGIPNVLIQSDDAEFEAAGTAITCRAEDTAEGVNEIDNAGGGNGSDPVPGTIIDTNNTNTTHEAADGTLTYLKASDMDNFDADLKKVFSEDEFACCLPGGTPVNDTIPEKNCCTGFIANTNNQGPRCCLPDYTNVTLYLNRYVSSEMQDFPDTDFDPKTGRPLSIQKVQAFAANICCSGEFTTGQAYDDLLIPNQGNNTDRSLRFISGNRPEDDELAAFNATNFDRGLKWNTDVYCVPAGN